MRIISVHLKNIKSHRDTELSFSAGINVLSGPNGAGKSTVFEAIGYALFGVNAQDFVSRVERFLSIGAKRGEVAVVFQPADGEEYRVTRTVGPSSKWLLARKVGDQFEVEDHASLQETESRIAKLLGLNSGRPLAEQFKLVIGPFQNDFLGPFVIKQPTRRQDTFDEILGIDAWRKTFDGTKSLAGAIQAKSDTIRAEVAGREEQVAALPGKRAELQGVREAQGSKRRELSDQGRALEQAGAVLAACEAGKNGLDQAQRELQTLVDRIASGKDHVANQQLLVDQAQQSSTLVAASRGGKERFDRAEERLKVLRGEEQAKLALERRAAELEKEHAGIASAQQIEQRELLAWTEAVQKEGELLSARALDQNGAWKLLQQEEEQARAALAAVQRSLASFRELPLHRIENTLPHLLARLDRMAAIDADSAARQESLEGEAEMVARAGELSGLKTRLEEVQARKSELSGRRLSLIEGREKLGSGACPFFHEPCRNLSETASADPISSRIDRLEEEMERWDAAAGELAAAVACAQSAEIQVAAMAKVRADLLQLAQERGKVAREFEQHFKEIAPEKLSSTLAQWLESAQFPEPDRYRAEMALAADGTPLEKRRGLELWKVRVQEIAARLEEALSAQLKEAEEPVRQCDRKRVELSSLGKELERLQAELSARREKVAGREEAIARGQQRLLAVRESLRQLNQELSAHQGLEERIAAAQAELEQYRPDRDRFIANEKAAQELEQRRETLGKYRQALQSLEVQRDGKMRELERLREGYNEQRHQEARQERERLLSLGATLAAELAALEDGAQRLEGEVSVLDAIAQEVRRKLAELDRLAEKGELVKFLRNQVFKNVSTQLSERFREEISYRADRIYRSIAESDEELIWGDNYRVVLKDMADGVVRERSDDQLSGGQMMSAVVALRLALLQTTGARIAFFDEPTSNLDAERRENLARAFRAIDVGQEEVTEHWYDQLFLVSHDVSFTEITDQMIQLEPPRPA